MNANWLSAPSPEECAPFDATASSGTHCPDRGFEVGTHLGVERGLGRTGVIHTAHGIIPVSYTHLPYSQVGEHIVLAHLCIQDMRLPGHA